MPETTKSEHPRIEFMGDTLNKTIAPVPNRNWQAINIRTPADAFCPMTTNVATALEIDGDNAVHTGVIDRRTFELSRWVQPESFFVLHRHRSGAQQRPIQMPKSRRSNRAFLVQLRIYLPNILATTKITNAPTTPPPPKRYIIE